MGWGRIGGREGCSNVLVMVNGWMDYGNKTG